MALSDSNTYDIYEKLKYNFLFNNDINCIHILLNLYDLESNISNIFPKYVSMNSIKKSIRTSLRDRRDNRLISYNLGELIHEDINRLELFLYLEGYKHGSLNNKNANILEGITIKYFSIPNLYNRKYLFHFDNKTPEIKKIKRKIYNMLKKDEEVNEKLKSTINNYLSNLVKPKVLSLNKYLDKQLTIDYDSDAFNIREDGSFLTLDELNKIYDKIVQTMMRNGYKIYNSAYWNGLNDRVLKRYS